MLRTCCNVEIDAAGSRPGVPQNQLKAGRKYVANPHELVENLVANLVENQVYDQVCSWLE